jgi:GNAT superfamily N-acetyltransferase
MSSQSNLVAQSSRNGLITIRRAVPADGPVILGLIQALADYEKLAPPDEAAQRRLLADAFADPPRFAVFLAEVSADESGGSVPAGYAIVFETYSTFLALPTLYLEDIFVLESHRNRRIGFSLFRFCIREAHRRGCGRMEWTVLDWNKPSIDFYDRQGARHLGEWLHYRLDADQLASISAAKE